jgi:hypothetical protein
MNISFRHESSSVWKSRKSPNKTDDFVMHFHARSTTSLKFFTGIFTIAPVSWPSLHQTISAPPTSIKSATPSSYNVPISHKICESTVHYSLLIIYMGLKYTLFWKNAVPIRIRLKYVIKVLISQCLPHTNFTVNILSLVLYTLIVNNLSLVLTILSHQFCSIVLPNGTNPASIKVSTTLVTVAATPGVKFNQCKIFDEHVFTTKYGNRPTSGHKNVSAACPNAVFTSNHYW